ncbi:MAG: hypothetical protein ACKER6_01085 [Candidatus Hodgkinia cicadicola]
MRREAQNMAPTSLDESSTIDGAMTGLWRPVLGFVCIVVGVFVCANSAWSSFRHLWRSDKPTSLDHPKDAALLARKMAAAHAAIGYLKSEVQADAAISRELDRLMRSNGSQEPKPALKEIIARSDAKARPPVVKADAGSKVGKAASAEGTATNAKRSPMADGNAIKTKTNRVPKPTKKPKQNHNPSRKGPSSHSVTEPKETSPRIDDDGRC